MSDVTKNANSINEVGKQVKSVIQNVADFNTNADIITGIGQNVKLLTERMSEFDKNAKNNANLDDDVRTIVKSVEGIDLNTKKITDIEHDVTSISQRVNDIYYTCDRVDTIVQTVKDLQLDLQLDLQTDQSETIKEPDSHQLSDIVEVKGSTFQAFGKAIFSPKEAYDFISFILSSSYMDGKQHCYSAYVLNENPIDVDEGRGSMTIKSIMQKHCVLNTVIVILRKFGGKHISDMRWKSVEEVSTDLLHKMNKIRSSNAYSSAKGDILQVHVPHTSNRVSANGVVLNNYAVTSATSPMNDHLRNDSLLIENRSGDSTGSDHANMNVDRMVNNGDSVIGDVSSFDSSVSDLDNDADVIMFTDSVGKHINQRQFFGINKKTTLRRTPRIENVLNDLNNCELNSKASNVVIHVGINDAKNNTPNDKIIQNLLMATEKVKAKFPNADIVISNLVINPTCDTHLVSRVKEINDGLKQMCIRENIKFASHNTLNNSPDLFVDNFHISDSGTRLLVNNILKAKLVKTRKSLPSHGNMPRSVNQYDQKRVVNYENGHRLANQYDHKRVVNRQHNLHQSNPSAVTSNGHVTDNKGSDSSIDVDKFLQVLTLKLLKDIKL